MRTAGTSHMCAERIFLLFSDRPTRRAHAPRVGPSYHIPDITCDANFIFVPPPVPPHGECSTFQHSLDPPLCTTPVQAAPTTSRGFF